jgi:hypothetical protein
MAIEVLSIQPRVDVTPTGDLVAVYHIRFRTEKGALGVVQVPQEGFDPEKVKEIIRERAAQLDALYEI